MRSALYYIKLFCCAVFCVMVLGGCMSSHSEENEEKVQSDIRHQRVPDTMISEDIVQDMEPPVPDVMEADWSAIFDGLNGAAVLYDSSS